MLTGLPDKALDVMSWEWSQFAPYYAEMESRDLTPATIADWLADWSHLDDLLGEVAARLRIATTLDTASPEAKHNFTRYLDTIYPPASEADQRLKQKFLASGLEPEGFDVPLRNMRAEADLFRQENLPLLAEHQKLGLAYDTIVGRLSVEWDGSEVTLHQLVPLVKDADRATRERAWRLASTRVLQERDAINENWTKLVNVRRQIAKNAGKKDFRDYAWQQRLRFDYTVEDAQTFHRAIEEVVVPATARVFERRRQQWAVESLRPWDVGVSVMQFTQLTGDPTNRPPITPFTTIDQLVEQGQRVFDRVDPVLGDYFGTMRREDLLNLPNYKGKGPGAYCSSFPTEKRPFVFMNAVGTADDVRTLLHECGHAFHGFERFQHQPLSALRVSPMEFNEVASMAMELLGAPYLKASEGGFYTDEEAARTMVEHLEHILIFWPYMAVVDAFNHWANTSDSGHDPAAADAMWGDHWDRYIVGVDFSDLEDEKVTGWQRKQHIHRVPFYYIEYGLAQLGSVQIWRNAITDQARAVEDYRRALALGGSVTLPELYRTAGAKFAFDAATLRDAVDLIETTIDRFESQIEHS
jgi:oligoendopeptidase F